MTEQQEFILYAVLIIVILTFIVTFIFYSKNLEFFKRFASKRFQINVLLKLNPKTMEERIELNVYNGNFIDERLHGLGIIYKNKNIDYTSTFLEKNNISNDVKPIVLAHDFVKIEIPLDELKKTILIYNENDHYVEKIKAYAINSQGLITKTNVKALRKIIRSIIKKELIESKTQKKIEVKRIKEQKKQNEKVNQNGFKQRFQKIIKKIKEFIKKMITKIKTSKNQKEDTGDITNSNDEE